MSALLLVSACSHASSPKRAQDRPARPVAGEVAGVGQPESADSDAPTIVQRAELGAHIRALNPAYAGVFVMLDPARNEIITSDTAWAERGFIPASTFKIPNSLIALETGVASGPDFTLPWDGVERRIASWNRDHDLVSAFAVSALWYYQELARRTGQARMAKWVDALDYGNGKIGGGIDSFWLNGELRISAFEQVDFLYRLHEGKLPLSASTVDRFLNEVMVYARDEDTVLRAKTGWAQSADFPDDAQPGFEGNLGWFVGSVERERGGELERVYFATLLTAPEPAPAGFGQARKQLATDLLGELGWPVPEPG